MADLYELGLEVRSDGVVVASDRLRKLASDGAAAERSTNKLASSTSNLERYFRMAVKALGAYKLYDMVREAALLSARYDTLGVVMNTVGATAGYTNSQMAAFERQLQKGGIAMVESRQVLTQMAQAQLDLAKSAELSRVAQDAATIGGINSSEAFERLVSGIQKGETEILKTIGINVSFEQSYNKLALTLGKSADSLTEAEKAQARMNIVLERGKDIAGAYDAAMGTAGKQLTSIKRYVDNLKVTLGSVFNDALIVGVQVFTGGLKEAQTEADKLAEQRKLEEWGRGLVMVMATVADGIRFVYNVLQTLVTTGVAGFQQLYYGASAFLKVLSWDFAGAKESFREMLLVGEAWADIVSQQWDGPIDKFQQAAKAMYAARDANKALDEQKKKQLEGQRLSAGAANREAAAAEELAQTVKKNQDAWGKIVVSQLEAVGAYEQAAQKATELNKLGNDYLTMKNAAAKSQEAAAALQAQEVLDQQRMLEAKAKTLDLENNHLAAMRSIETAKLSALGIDNDAIAAAMAAAAARLEEKKLLDQIATEINPLRRQQLSEQLAGQRELNALVTAEARERNKIKLINDQFALLQQQIDMQKQQGFEREAFEQQKNLDMLRLKFDYHQQMLDYQRQLNVATEEEGTIIRRNMELYQQLSMAQARAVDTRQYQATAAVASGSGGSGGGYGTTWGYDSNGNLVNPSVGPMGGGPVGEGRTGWVDGRLYLKGIQTSSYWNSAEAFSAATTAVSLQSVGSAGEWQAQKRQERAEQERKLAEERAAAAEAARVAAEAEAQRQKALAAATAALNDDLAVRRLAVQGLDDEAAVVKLLIQQRNELTKYQEQGIDVSQLQIVQQAELNRLIQQQAVKRLSDQVRTLFDSLNTGLNSIAGSTRNLVSALQSASANLKTAGADLLTSDAALSPEQLYADTRQRLLQTSQQAITQGNADLLNQIPSLVSSFLSASRGYFGSSASYQSDFATAQGILADAGTAADIYANAMAPVQTAADKQVELLQQLNDAINSGNVSLAQKLMQNADANNATLNAAVNNVASITGQVSTGINGSGGTNQWLSGVNSNLLPSGPVVSALTGPTSVLSGLTGSSGVTNRLDNQTNSLASWLQTVNGTTATVNSSLGSVYSAVSPISSVASNTGSIAGSTGSIASSTGSIAGTNGQVVSYTANIDSKTGKLKSSNTVHFYTYKSNGQIEQESEVTSYQYYAKGGLYPGGSAIMGELGPEFVDSSPGYVYRADETKALFEMARRGVASADNYGLIEEIRALRAEVAQLRSESVGELREIKSPLRRVVAGR